MAPLMDVFALILPEVKELLSEKNFSELKDLLKKLHSIDIAEGFKHLTPQEKIIIFKLLGTKKAVEVFESLLISERAYILNNLANEEISQILNETAPDERAKLFRELPPRVMKKFMGLIKKPELDAVERILNYPKDTAGGIMTTEFVELKKEMTARKAILNLQEVYHAGQTETIYSVYVTSEEHRLIGSISLQMLITAPPDILIKDLMSPIESIKASADSQKEEVVKLFVKYDLSDLPVVDTENRLIGIIHVDDVIDEIRKINTTTLYELGKMTTKKGEEIEYSSAKVTDLVKRRAGWLILLLIFDFLTGTVLKTFEHALSSVVALAFFIPMLLDTGGNAGNQTAITIIRGLATGDVTFKNAKRVIRMELLASLFMGIIVGIVAFIRSFLLQKDPTLAIVVGITMMLIVLLAIATGISLPLISKKLGLDPAVLAGPITTSVVDVVGLIIYFKIAQAFIHVL